MIKKIIIKNFKQFEDFELELNPDVNIIVGNNEAGKTTLFEAINLALIQRLNGRLIMQELTPYLFNRKEKDRYLSDLNDSSKIAKLPEILIEIYFTDEPNNADFKGSMNSLKEDCAGVSLKICFDSDFQKEYEKYIEKPEAVKEIPIEYYKVEWYSFASNTFRFLELPMKAHLINNIEHRYLQGPDKYIASLVGDYLDDNQKSLLALKYRQLKEDFTDDTKIQEINDKFKETGNKISDKDVQISIDISAKNSWDSILSLYFDDIPFKLIGKGEQNAVKIKLALKEKIDKCDLIMIEEPETSLSFSNLNRLIKSIEDSCKCKQILISTHSSFVANKTGLDKIILLNRGKCSKIKDLDRETYDYFKKLSGYDTLRMILANKTILVEGPSDELVLQKAYLNKYGKLPIEDGTDVISVSSLAFNRFLDIAKHLDLNVVVVTDNDGNLDALAEKYTEYSGVDSVKICYSNDITLKTLEPQIYASNGYDKLKVLFKRPSTDDEEKFKKFFCSNKTDVALAIFNSTNGAVNFPQYILDAIEK
jgi:predicted ATPase